jgi:hypothetical protein
MLLEIRRLARTNVERTRMGLLVLLRAISPGRKVGRSPGLFN